MTAAHSSSALPPGEIRALAADRQWQALVERVSSTPEEQLYADPEVAFHFADALWRVGRAPEALMVTDRLEGMVRSSGDRRLLVNLINVIGICHFEMGQNTEAEQRFSELLELASDWQDEEFAARASNNLGMLANIRGQRDLALTYYQRALAAYQRLGYIRGLAQTHHNLGISYRDLGFDSEADAHYRRAIDFAQAAGSADVIALAETERAMLRARAGDGAFAETLAHRALQRFDTMGDPIGRAEALRVLAAAARVGEHYELAAERLDAALEIAQDHADPLLRAEVQRDRGLLLRDRGAGAAARAALLDAAENFTMIGAAAEAEAVRVLERELTASTS